MLKTKQVETLKMTVESFVTFPSTRVQQSVSSMSATNSELAWRYMLERQEISFQKAFNALQRLKFIGIYAQTDDLSPCEVGMTLNDAESILKKVDPSSIPDNCWYDYYATWSMVKLLGDGSRKTAYRVYKLAMKHMTDADK